MDAAAVGVAVVQDGIMVGVVGQEAVGVAVEGAVGLVNVVGPVMVGVASQTRLHLHPPPNSSTVPQV